MNSVEILMSFIDKSKIVEARQALRNIAPEVFKTERQWYFFQTNELEAKIDRIYFYVWNTTLDAVRTRSKKEDVLFKRQIGIYCLSTSLKFTDEQVAEIFNRDRTVILHSVKVVRNRMKYSEEAKRKVHHFRRLLNDALGQMEIESIKKQENPENIGVLPSSNSHFGVKEKKLMSMDEFSKIRTDSEIARNKLDMRESMKKIDKLAGEILAGKTPPLFCEKIKESKKQESE